MKYEATANYPNRVDVLGSHSDTQDRAEATFALKEKGARGIRRTLRGLAGLLLGFFAVASIVYLISRCSIHLSSQRLASAGSRRLAEEGVKTSSSNSSSSQASSCESIDSQEAVSKKGMHYSSAASALSAAEAAADTAEAADRRAELVEGAAGEGPYQNCIYTFPRIDGAEQHRALKDLMQRVRDFKHYHRHRREERISFTSAEGVLLTVTVKELKKTVGHPSKLDIAKLGLYLEELLVTAVSDVYGNGNNSFSERKEVLDIFSKSGERVASLKLTVTATWEPTASPLRTLEDETDVRHPASLRRALSRLLRTRAGSRTPPHLGGSLPSLPKLKRTASQELSKSKSVDALQASNEGSRLSQFVQQPRRRTDKRLFRALGEREKDVLMTMLTGAIGMRKSSHPTKIVRVVLVEGVQVTVVLQRLLFTAGWPSDKEVIDLGVKLEDGIARAVAKSKRSGGISSAVAYFDIHKEGKLKGENHVFAQITGSVIATSTPSTDSGGSSGSGSGETASPWVLRSDFHSATSESDSSEEPSSASSSSPQAAEAEDSEVLLLRKETTV